VEEAKDRSRRACIQQRGVSINPTTANVSCTPHRAPADGSTDMPSGGSGHADTINSYPTGAACHADLHGHAVRLVKRDDWHGLHRCCEDQSKSNSDQPNHCFSPILPSRRDVLEECKKLSRRSVCSMCLAPVRFRRTFTRWPLPMLLSGNMVSHERVTPSARKCRKP
jgi:hypothetical protein